MPAAKQSLLDPQQTPSDDVEAGDRPGLLYVLTKPKPGYEQDYHDWYDTEHGPQRMQLDFVRSGYRYRELVADQPKSSPGNGEIAEDMTYMAMYDLLRVGGLGEVEYARMRKVRSEREMEVLGRKMALVDRRVYELVSSRGEGEGPAAVVMSVTLVMGRQVEGEVHKWYEEEHTGDLSRIQGWQRTRRYRMVSDGESTEDVELLAVHEFGEVNGLDGPEHVRARSTPWRNAIMEKVSSRENRRWEFFHEFKAEDYVPP
jgi:hypothetical protein